MFFGTKFFQSLGTVYRSGLVGFAAAAAAAAEYSNVDAHLLHHHHTHFEQGRRNLGCRGRLIRWGQGENWPHPLPNLGKNRWKSIFFKSFYLYIIQLAPLALRFSELPTDLIFKIHFNRHNVKSYHFKIIAQTLISVDFCFEHFPIYD